MNILFVCTANRDRSRTAEVHFASKYPDHSFASCGINKYLSERHEHGIHMKREFLELADRIICMERVHKKYILQRYGRKFLHKVEVLNLGDTENFMSADLIEILEEKFKI